MRLRCERKERNDFARERNKFKKKTKKKIYIKELNLLIKNIYTHLEWCVTRQNKTSKIHSHGNISLKQGKTRVKWSRLDGWDFFVIPQLMVLRMIWKVILRRGPFYWLSWRITWIVPKKIKMKKKGLYALIKQVLPWSQPYIGL